MNRPVPAFRLTQLPFGPWSCERPRTAPNRRPSPDGAFLAKAITSFVAPDSDGVPPSGDREELELLPRRNGDVCRFCLEAPASAGAQIASRSWHGKRQTGSRTMSSE